MDYGRSFEGIINDPLLVTEDYRAFTEFCEQMRSYAGVVKSWPPTYSNSAT